MSQSSPLNPSSITGLILAGGLSWRMNKQEKSFLKLAGKPLIAHVYDKLALQVGEVVISANGDPSRFSSFNSQVIADKRKGSFGPLAGIEAAFLSHKADWLLSVPVDTPFFPQDLAKKMCQSAQGRDVPVVAKSFLRLHPVVALWPRSVLPKLSAALDSQKLKLHDWFLQQEHIKLDFTVETEDQDPFFNINRPSDKLSADRYFLNSKK
ncbi:MAG: molybdenum cofactor guanylyltransferase [Magnetococcales bacterium]|nr:molybdenum cofactor guanylyltransferase [Magnetococcales bacterium]